MTDRHHRNAQAVVQGPEIAVREICGSHRPYAGIGHGDDTAGTHQDRDMFQRRRDLDRSSALARYTGPVIDPFASGKYGDRVLEPSLTIGATSNFSPNRYSYSAS